MRSILNPFIKKKTKFGCIAMLSLLLTGCGSVPDLSIDTVSIYSEPDANQNSATAVDLVLVYNEDLAKTIGAMTASKYFESANQLLLDNPTLIDVWRWELVPGQIVEDFEPEQDKGDAIAGYVFANYLTPGPHRIKVAPDGVIKILLANKDVKNLAMLNVHDVNTGETMTDQGASEDAVESSAAQAKIGPVTPPKKQAQKQGPCVDDNSCDEPNPCLSKAPVKITPLPPSPHKPCNPKASK